MHESNTFATFSYDGTSVDFCIFDGQSFSIGHFVDEDNQLTCTRSIIVKNNIGKVFLSLDVVVEKFIIIKGICEVELIKINRTNAFVASHDLMCLYALKETVGINDVFTEIVDDTINENSLVRVGVCGNYPVYIIELDGRLYYDNLTMNDLDIISSDKDNISLFQRMNFTKTLYGESTLRSWLLHPLNDLKAITERQDLIAFVEDNMCTDQLAKFSTFYKGREVELVKLRQFLKQTFKLIESLLNTPVSFRKDLEDYKKILFNIDILKGNHLKKGISKDYDELREIYENLPSYLNRVATNLAYKNNAKLSVVYFPHVGYLIESLKKDIDEYTLKKIIEDNDDQEVESSRTSMTYISRRSMDNNFLISSTLKCSEMTNYSRDQNTTITGNYSFYKDKLEKVLLKSNRNKRRKASVSNVSSNIENFMTNNKQRFAPYTFYLKNSLFIKNQLMNKLDEDLGDIFNLMEEIKKKEIHDRTSSLNFSLINDLVSYIGKIDALSSLNQFKKKYNCSKPQFTIYEESNWKIKIVNFCYQNVFIDIDKNLIFRGSQKILKIIGQVSIIAQMGSFVLCTSVTIPMFDKLFTSMNVKESLGFSYFLSSVKRMGTILQFSTWKTLVLLDSFGYGTNIDEAYRIFVSIHKNIKYPIVISLTQFTQLFKKNEDNNDDLYLKKYIIRCESMKENLLTLSKEMNDEFVEFEKCLQDNKFENSFISQVKTEFKNLKK